MFVFQGKKEKKFILRLFNRVSVRSSSCQFIRKEKFKSVDIICNKASTHQIKTYSIQNNGLFFQLIFKTFIITIFISYCVWNVIPYSSKLCTERTSWSTNVHISKWWIDLERISGGSRVWLFHEFWQQRWWWIINCKSCIYALSAKVLSVQDQWQYHFYGWIVTEFHFEYILIWLALAFKSANTLMVGPMLWDS